MTKRAKPEAQSKEALLGAILFARQDAEQLFAQLNDLSSKVINDTDDSEIKVLFRNAIDLSQEIRHRLIAFQPQPE